MGFTSIAIEVSTACTRCQAPLPLNGASESVLCDTCQTPNATDVGLWTSILGDAIGEAVAMEPDTAHTSTIMTGARTLKVLAGKQDARCKCKAPFDPAAFERGASHGKLFCTSCGAESAVRRAPEWMKQVHAATTYLVGETLAAPRAKAVAASDLRFHCYHCGAPLPIDGSTRSVTCDHCRAAVMVPDDIWLRLHPARTVDRWYAVLALDLSNAKGALPTSVDSFCDVCAEPGGHVIVAYHSEDKGSAGHRARIALLQPTGALTWIQDGIEFSDDARLCSSPVDGTCFLVDRENHFVRAIDPRTGDPIRTFKSRDNDDDDDDDDATPQTLDVNNVYRFAIDWDGSFLTNNGKLRRYAPDGHRVPTWPGMRIGQGESDDQIRGNKWPRRNPVCMDSDVRIGVGWDGAVYFVHDEGIAKYTRDGQLIGAIPFPGEIVSDVVGFTVARDGTMMVLFVHRTPIGDDTWKHVMRVSPNGQMTLALGPHVPGSPLIGRYVDRIKGYADGTLILASGVDALRVIAPDGHVAWMTNATRKDEAYEQKRLDEGRRGKKAVADRE
jgi:hypothetical protein